MANMSYCRFENTYHDFCDCENTLDEMNWEDETLDTLSESEQYYAERLYHAAMNFVNLYEELKEKENK